MWNYFRDAWAARCLRARYSRLVQERLLEMVEQSSPVPVRSDPPGWMSVGVGPQLLGYDPGEARRKSRELAGSHPHIRNILRLLEIYVVGPGFRLGHSSILPESDEIDLIRQADRIWNEFLERNRDHYSLREHARRVWRDGESFLRLFPLGDGGLTVRFIDPELITGGLNGVGIETDPLDGEKRLSYHKAHLEGGSEEIPSSQIIHSRIECDSNELRGRPLIWSLIGSIEKFDSWLDTELQARKLQASIVLWRKVQGGPSQVSQFADQQSQRSGSDSTGTYRQERMRPGTILTTSAGTDLQFLQPSTNFGDAVPLGRMLLLCTAAGAGLPEFMVTGDASNSNLASTMVAEGPAVKQFQAEQAYFAGEFQKLWRNVMSEQMLHGRLPGDIFERITSQWTFPPLIHRDRPKERLADVRLVEAGILSRAEVARRDGVEPTVMKSERVDEEME